MIKEIHVVGAAIKDGNRILAARRSSRMKSPLKWEFVGGKVESGETHQQALKREVQEELGVGIDVKGFVAEGCSEDGERKIVLHIYEAVIIEGEPAATEHDEIRWVDIRDLNELEWAEADIPACRELVKRYGGFL